VKFAWPREWPLRLAWIGISLAGMLAATAPWLSAWRVAVVDPAAQHVIIVTTGADRGMGSLREAILTADRADEHKRILVMVPRIALESPLPPLVNPNGILLEAHRGDTEIDASRLEGAALDLAAPHTTVLGFRIVKAKAAIVVRSSHITVQSVTIEDSDIGVLVGEGSEEVTIDRGTFKRNRVGVHAMGLGRTEIIASRFEDHGGSAVWAVAPEAAAGLPDISVHDSRFTNDRSGLVFVNRPAKVERNVFEGVRENAVFTGGARAVIRTNQIRSGRGFAILLDQSSSAIVSRNEIAHNCSGGVMVRNARNTEIVSNELYQNGLGIVVLEGQKVSPNTVSDNLITDHASDGLLLIASSPMVRHNRLLQNMHSGLRLAWLARDNGPPTEANPLLEGNVLRGNGRDEPYRDEYVQKKGNSLDVPASDCAWRLAAARLPGMEGVR
jgi:parallel beta helix pectate lyase-like protein